MNVAHQGRGIGLEPGNGIGREVRRQCLFGLGPAEHAVRSGTDDRDELYAEAVEVVIREQLGSVSRLQRFLGIGYGRAARLVDYMAEDGIVGDYNGSKAREVLYTMEEWEALKAGREEVPA